MKKLINRLVLCLVGVVGVNGQTLVWDKNTEPDLVGYKVYQQGPQGTKVHSVTNNSFSLKGLEPATTNQFYVTAVNSQGVESEPSEILPFESNFPAAPEVNEYSVKKEGSEFIVNLSWDPAPTQQWVKGYYVLVMQDNASTAEKHFVTGTNTTVRIARAKITNLYLQATNVFGVSAMTPVGVIYDLAKPGNLRVE